MYAEVGDVGCLQMRLVGALVLKLGVDDHRAWIVLVLEEADQAASGLVRPDPRDVLEEEEAE
jgi:hypothetical protein